MREINPFGLRMPEDLRARITDQARLNGRSLNAEIIHRLQQSVDGTPILAAQQPRATYSGIDLTVAEQQMLAIFRRLPGDKQLSLLSLFR